MFTALTTGLISHVTDLEESNKCTGVITKMGFRLISKSQFQLQKRSELKSLDYTHFGFNTGDTNLEMH